MSARPPFGILARHAVASLALLLSQPVYADDDLPRMLTLDELADARGGFTIAGLEISLGADLRTYIDGELALRTVFSIRGNEVTTERFVADTLTPAVAAQATNAILSGDMSGGLGDEQLFLANEGQTALLQRLDGGLQNLVFNTASGTDLRMEADVLIGLANLAVFQAAVSPSFVMNGINDAIAASVSPLGGG